MTRTLSSDDRCLNCFSPIRGGRFCQACGQEHLLEAYSVRDMFGHVLGEFFSLDSKVIRSVVPLVVNPGRLTNEYRTGRRTHFVRPLRLYLAASILFFLVLSVVGNTSEIFTFSDGSSGEREPITAESMSALTDSIRTERAASTAALADSLAAAGATDEADSLAAARAEDDRWLTLDTDEIRTVPVVGNLFASRVDRANELGQEATFSVLGDGVVRYMPRVFFLMVPIFALVMQLLYIRRQRYYVEHLVFLFHVQAFYFLLASVVFLVSFDPVKIACMVWAVIYLYKAVRNVYGQGRFKSIWKSLVLVNGSMVLIMVGAAVAAAVSVLTF